MKQSNAVLSVAGGAFAAYALLGRSRASLIAAAAGGVVAGAILTTRLLGKSETARKVPGFAKGFLVKRSIVVNARPEECYRVWRDFANLPRFLPHIVSVRVMDDVSSLWEAGVRGGGTVYWRAEMLADVEHEMIGWRSENDRPVDMAGSVRFERVRIPGGRGTEVRITLRYRPRGGRLGAKVIEWFWNSPEKEVEDALVRFKNFMEKAPEANDAVDEASIESFPASDPPSWTAAHA